MAGEEQFLKKKYEKASDKVIFEERDLSKMKEVKSYR